MKKKIAFAVFLVLGVMAALFAWYDEQLFTSTSSAQIPFIMILMDTSASMNHVVYYPLNGIDGLSTNSGYDPARSGGYSGTINANLFRNANYETATEISHQVGGYFGWRVLNTSAVKTVNGYNHIGQVLIAGPDSIQISRDTYLWSDSPAGIWIVGRMSGAYARVTARRTTLSANGKITYYWFDITERGGTFPENNTSFMNGEMLTGIQALGASEVLKRGYFYGYVDDYNADTDETMYVRYMKDYLKWLLLYASYSETFPYGQLQETSYFHKYSTFDTSIAVSDTPVGSSTMETNCKCPSISGEKRLTITRIQAGREAMCKITNDNWGRIVLGISRFANPGVDRDGNPVVIQGGTIIENLNNSSDASVILAGIYTNTRANTGTPLAAAMADLWAYWKPQGGSQGTYWPTGWGTDGLYHSYAPAASTAGFGPPGLGATECNHFYNILVTDGQSSNDTFADTKFTNSIFTSPLKSPVRRSGELTSRWDYRNGWGDYDSHDPNSSSSDYCPIAGSCWTSSGSDYLDDVAYLMYNSDMCPNQSPVGKPEEDLYPRWPGDQNIVTHVVGFNHVNDLLRATASNGGGQFYLSSNYEDLSNQLQAALDEIFLREEQMMYNVFASPKQAVTAKSDLYGFKGTFIPQNGNTFWQGHLKCFQLAADGSFPDDSAANTKWDAFTKLVNTASADRKIYTFKYANEALTDSSNAFTATNILPTDLGLLAANTAGRDSVVNFIRGENGFGYKLGDIFHFNPIVVGSPLVWKGAFDQSYQDFYDDNVGRKEVVYVGTNDGMLHCFRVQKPDSEGNPDVSLGGEELWGFIPPSQLRRVKNLFMINALEILRNVPCAYAIPNPGDLCMTYGFDRYFVDGKAMVKDIKIGSEWKTVLIFGMGIGGTSYCALDVSDPDDPKFLWEFTTPLMGYTEARPIISAVNDGTSSFPAVFIPGGYDFWERPASAADPGSRTGKALYVLKAEPGVSFTPQIVKRFLWSATNTGEVDPPPDGIPTYTSTDFLYSFVAAPAVFDPNGDGVADYVYAPDTGDFRSGRPGGRIWKIPVLGDPDGWVPEKIFQAANSQVFFLSPTLGYDTDWNLWVYIGSGRRSQITANDGGHVCLDPLTGDPILDPITGLTTTCYTFTNTNGCFYAFWDKPTNPKPLDGSSATYFKDITALFGATPSDDEKKLASTQVGICFNYFRLAPEVIFEPTPILVNNVLTMNTYSPTVASGSTVCGNSTGFSGKHSIYQFTLGKIGSSIAVTTTNAFGGKILGSGVLSSGEYIVYIGAETVGTFTPTGYYRPSLEDTFGPILWKEEKQ